VGTDREVVLQRHRQVGIPFWAPGRRTLTVGGGPRWHTTARGRRRGGSGAATDVRVGAVNEEAVVCVTLVE
jgi:hypothetical protein